MLLLLSGSLHTLDNHWELGRHIDLNPPVVAQSYIQLTFHVNPGLDTRLESLLNTPVDLRSDLGLDNRVIAALAAGLYTGLEACSDVGLDL